MISFEIFNEYMNSYREIIKKENDLNAALSSFSPDFGGFYLDDVHVLFLKMLGRLVRDKSNWIEYYIYELDWGQSWDENSVMDADGNSIPLGTIEDLYNLLESEYDAK